MKKFLANLRTQAEENPMVAVGVATAAAAVAAKLIDSMVSSRNSQTWAKEVKRRERKS